VFGKTNVSPGNIPIVRAMGFRYRHIFRPIHKPIFAQRIKVVVGAGEENIRKNGFGFPLRPSTHLAAWDAI
jgi:hypothetical protein